MISTTPSTDFYFQVLGANSAVPDAGRFPSSFILGHKEHLYLIDCGEGAQMKMSEFHVKRSKINTIFISHLHGDHVFGLPGILNSFSLSSRKRPLTIIGPEGIQQYIKGIFESTQGFLSYELIFRELSGDQPINLGDIDDMKVIAFPLVHRILTFGYRFDEVHREVNIDPLAIAKYNLTIPEIIGIKNGEVIVREDRSIPQSELVKAPKPTRSFAYCSDTLYHPPIQTYVQGVDLLYHEATYLHDMAEKALKYQHSTAQEAAMIARDAGVKSLLIGHYSSRYKDLNVLAAEAQATFDNSMVAIQGSIHPI